jgi:hypothetical protein
MAWNGSNGVLANDPGYVTYTAWRNTPLEESAKDFLLARAGLPLGARLWTFGTWRHADGDGWVAEQGAAALGKGRFEMQADADGTMAVVSPGDLALARTSARALVLGLPDDVRVHDIEVLAAFDGLPAWRSIALLRGDAVAREQAGRVLALSRGGAGKTIDRLKVVMRFDARTRVDLERVAVLP